MILTVDLPIHNHRPSLITDIFKHRTDETITNYYCKWTSKLPTDGDIKHQDELISFLEAYKGIMSHHLHYFVDSYFYQKL